MGAWGMGPNDNDAALDWAGRALDRIEPLLREALGRGEPEVIRMATVTYVGLRRTLYPVVFGQQDQQLGRDLLGALSALRHGREFHDWREAWDDPVGLGMILDREIEDLRRAIADGLAVGDRVETPHDGPGRITAFETPRKRAVVLLDTPINNGGELLPDMAYERDELVAIPR